MYLTTANANNLKGTVQPALNDLVAEMDMEKEYSESPKKVEPNVNIKMQLNLKTTEIDTKRFTAKEKV
jgi:hypothetical protein